MKAKLLMLVPVMLRSFFQAVTNVAWGVGSIFFLNLMVVYFLKEEMPYEMSLRFLQLEMFITSHIMLFFWAALAVYLYYDCKELMKEDKK